MRGETSHRKEEVKRESAVGDRITPLSGERGGRSYSTIAFSTTWWTSWAVVPNDRSQAESVFARPAILSSGTSVCFTSVAVKMPMGSRAFAQARSTAISYGSSRRSNAKDRWNASNCSFGARSKRPPHSRSSLRSVISYRSGLQTIGSRKMLRRQRFLCRGAPTGSERPYKHKLLFVAFRFGLGTHSYWQRKQIDEAFCVFGVVAAHGEAGQIGAVQREGRNTLRNVESALPEFQADGASNALLRHVEKSVKRFAQRREPQTVVNEFRVPQRQRLLEMLGLAIDRETLEFLMRFD